MIESKGGKAKSTIISKDCNILLSITDKQSRQKINKYIEDFTNAMNKINLTDISRFSIINNRIHMLFKDT